MCASGMSATERWWECLGRCLPRYVHHFSAADLVFSDTEEGEWIALNNVKMFTLREALYSSGSSDTIIVLKITGKSWDQTWASPSEHNKTLSTSIKWAPLLYQRRLRKQKERDELCLSNAVPTVQCDSDPHCPWDYPATRNFFLPWKKCTKSNSKSEISSSSSWILCPNSDVFTRVIDNMI